MREPRFKRYIVFAFAHYYPEGGLDDVRGSFDTVDEALTFAKTIRADTTEIIDRETWQEVSITEASI